MLSAMTVKKAMLIASLTVTMTGGALIGADPAEAAATSSAATTTASADVAELKSLIGTQSRTQIEALVDGEAPISLYVDAASGKILAARSVAARALNPIGPGCTPTSVCMRSITGTPYGLSGTGTRTGSWKKIIRYSSGDRTTSFWASNGKAYTYRANSTVNMNVTVTMTKVQR